MADVEIKVRENGPYKGTGPITFIDADVNTYGPTERLLSRRGATGCQPDPRMPMLEELASLLKGGYEGRP